MLYHSNFSDWRTLQSGGYGACKSGIVKRLHQHPYGPGHIVVTDLFLNIWQGNLILLGLKHIFWHVLTIKLVKTKWKNQFLGQWTDQPSKVKFFFYPIQHIRTVYWTYTKKWTEMYTLGKLCFSALQFPYCSVGHRTHAKTQK